MNRIKLTGVDGSNPLGFLAALGLLRIVPGAKLGFSADGSFRAFIEGVDGGESDLANHIAADAEGAKAEKAPWRFAYMKDATKRQGSKQVADLKPPPDDFKRFLAASIKAWLAGNEEAAGYAAAYGTDVVVDGKGNTKPTAFHFTAAQQTFLGSVEGIRASVTHDWVNESLFIGHGAKKGANLRWDPGADRNWALMAGNPNAEGTRVDAPLEWLAFRGMPLLPCFPCGGQVVTTSVFGRGSQMVFRWPLWSGPASLRAARSALRIDWVGDDRKRAQIARDRAVRGIFAVCESSIKRSSQGFGNFSPAAIVG